MKFLLSIIYSPSKLLRDQRGFSLLLTFMFMITLTTMVAAYIFMNNQEMKYTGIHIDDVQAFYLSEAGLHKALWYLQNTAPDGSSDGSWRTTAYPAQPGSDSTDPQQENLGEGMYTLWVQDSGGDVLITARGTVNNVQRVIRHKVNVTNGGGVSISSVADSWQEI